MAGTLNNPAPALEPDPAALLPTYVDPERVSIEFSVDLRLIAGVLFTIELRHAAGCHEHCWTVHLIAELPDREADHCVELEFNECFSADAIPATAKVPLKLVPVFTPEDVIAAAIVAAAQVYLIVDDAPAIEKHTPVTVGVSVWGATFEAETTIGAFPVFDVPDGMLV